MKTKTVVRILLIAALTASVCACAWCIWYIAQYYQGQSFGEEMRVSGPKEPAAVYVPDDPEEEPTVEIPVDFDELREINPDIYAWIEIPGTEVSYAVLQREGNDSYYIRRSENGAYYSGGSIFSEDRNSRDFSDRLTVLYGHNLKNGQMFAKLNDFADVVVFDEYRDVNIYLPDRMLVYRVFAACPYSNEHLLVKYDFDNEADLDEFLSELRSVKSMDAQFREEDFPQNGEDRVLVLSTCYRQDRHERYLLCARLIEEIPATVSG